MGKSHMEHETVSPRGGVCTVDSHLPGSESYASQEVALPSGLMGLCTSDKIINYLVCVFTL